MRDGNWLDQHDAVLGHLPVIFGRRPVYSFLVVRMALVIYGLGQYGGRERTAA